MCIRDRAKALLLRLIDADSEISNTLALENFIQGFRLGMRLAMEGLSLIHIFLLCGFQVVRELCIRVEASRCV